MGFSSWISRNPLAHFKTQTYLTNYLKNVNVLFILDEFENRIFVKLFLIYDKNARIEKEK